MRKTFVMLLACAALGGGVAPPAAAQDLPAAAAPAEAFAPILAMVGRTWRGTSTAQPGVEDVMRWDWAIGGHAVRIVHSVNGGVYGGETLIFPDRASGDLIYHYFTTGGFHTTGVIRAGAEGGVEIEETVHGVPGLGRLRSHGRLDADGVYRTRTEAERDGAWVAFGGFDYREDAAAEVVLPAAGALIPG